MARKNSFETVTRLIYSEIEAYNRMMSENAQRGDYGNALIAQVSANVFSRALSMINACKPKGKPDGTEN